MGVLRFMHYNDSMEDEKNKKDEIINDNIDVQDDATRGKKKLRWDVAGGIIGGAVLIVVLVTAIILNNNGNNGSETAVDGSSVTGNTMIASRNITQPGTYEITGEYGAISINTSGDVKLILENATITSESGPAIYVEDADSVTMVLKGENTIAATSTTDELEGAIHSTDDLIIEGDGSLSVTGNLDGIVSKDALVIKAGNIMVNSGDDCIKGKDSVVINGGTFSLTSTGGDAIKSSNDEDAALGYIEINGGEFTIKTAQDGLQSETYTTINDGKFNIKAGDDAIHATTKLEVNGGDFTIVAAEGLEATYVLINDGNIDIAASDDGINAGQKSNALAVGIEINGGYVKIDMGAGDTDAVDSNGFLKITGGTIDITAQSPFDYDGTLTYTGGTIIVNGQTVNAVTNQVMGGPGEQNGAQGAPDGAGGGAPGGAPGMR